MKEQEYKKRNIWFLRHTKKHEAEHIRSIDETGKILIKTAIIINGAAALALLAFIGNAMSMELERHVVISLAFALNDFTWGVIAAAGCLFISYFLSLASYSAYIDAELFNIYYKDVVVLDLKLFKLKVWLVFPILYFIVVSLFLFSFITFVMGINGTSEAF